MDIIDECDVPGIHEQDTGQDAVEGSRGESPGILMCERWREPLPRGAFVRLPSADYEDESGRDADDLPEKLATGIRYEV